MKMKASTKISTIMSGRFFRSLFEYGYDARAKKYEILTLQGGPCDKDTIGVHNSINEISLTNWRVRAEFNSIDDNVRYHYRRINHEFYYQGTHEEYQNLGWIEEFKELQ
jgi:hypothetical protein